MHLVDDGWTAPSGIHGVHRLRHLRADLPRGQLEGRGRCHPRLPLRRLRSHAPRPCRPPAWPRSSTSRPLDGALLPDLRPALRSARPGSCSSTRRRPTSRRRSGRSRSDARPRTRRWRSYAAAIRDAWICNVPMGRPVLRADSFLPEKNWRVLASIGYMCDDPYTGTKGVEKVSEGVYKVTTRLATRKASRLHHVHLPAHGVARAAAPRLQPAARPLPVRASTTPRGR